MLKLIKLKIITSYHVGWRETRFIIDHDTILRALIDLAYKLNNTKLVNTIWNGEIKVSGILPLTKDLREEKFRLLTLFPPIPTRIKLSKISIKWITLTALYGLIKKSTECMHQNGVPYLKEYIDNKIDIVCISRKDYSESKLLELHILGVGKEGRSSIVDIREGSVEYDIMYNFISEYHNRIDRVTGSADIYMLTGYRISTPQWIAFKCEDKICDTLHQLIKLLGELGIGAYRSRGWGRFKIIEEEKLDIDNRDLEALQKYSDWSVNAYNVLLGSMYFRDEIDRENSFIQVKKLEGKGGSNVNEYDLKTLFLADIGSMVYLKKHVKPYVEVLKDPSGLNPLIIYNPLVISGV